MPQTETLFVLDEREIKIPVRAVRVLQVLEFPELPFRHHGFLTALEFAAQELHQPVQVRFQLHRLLDGEDYQEENNATEPFPSAQDDGNWTLLECPPGFQWCPLTNLCSSHNSCCNGSECANSSFGSSPAPGSLQPNTSQPSYELLKEFLFMVPAGPSSQYQVPFSNENIFVRPGDVFSIQHSAAPGSFLQCQRSASSVASRNSSGDNNDTWFAVLQLGGLGEGLSTHVLVAENAVSSQNITVTVKVEEPIRGLRATPDPESRVLLNTRVSYIPVMEAGSDVTFRWTVDDKPSFTFYNVVFNVIYQSPAVYKLSLTASNHVSNFTVNYNVTVEMMNRMRNLTVVGALPVVPQNSSVEFSARVHVDSAVEALFLWDFGDGVQETYLFKPPYNKSFLVPDPSVHEVVIEHNVSHIYQDPGMLSKALWGRRGSGIFGLRGEYALMVVVSNQYENLTHLSAVQVHSPLVAVQVEAEQDVLVVGRPVTFRATALPSPYGVVYTWDFGDSSSLLTEPQPTATHSYPRRGVYNVTVTANNTVSSVGAVECYQYRYRWDFGNNESTRSSGTEVTYTYKNTGVFLVTVTVSNNVSFNNDTAFVEVQEPVGVAKIEYNGTDVLELNQIYLFSASMNGTKVSYCWDFGDGTVQPGQVATHSYNSTGHYSITVMGQNDVSSNETTIDVTVKRRLFGLTVNASRTVVPLNGSVSFVATLVAGTAIRYSWILCDRCTPIQGSSTISYTFRSVGTFNVIVTAENKISSLQDSIFVYVLEQIEGLQVASTDLVEDLYFPTNKTLHLQAVVREGTNISYSWVVQRDGSAVQTFTGKTFLLSILEAGNYTVYLKATNMLGCATANRTLEFIESLGVLKPYAFPNPAAVNASVNISATITSGTGVMYMWYLEDGSSPVTSEPFIIHSFQSPGMIEVIVGAENKLNSTNATVSVCVEEAIEGLSIGTAELDCRYVSSGSTVVFEGELQRGTEVTWLWEVPNGTLSGQSVAVTFPTAGWYTVHLNASNDISWALASRNISVLDRIQGLEVVASKKVVEPGEQVTFEIRMLSGTSVNYLVSISGDYSVVLNSSRYSHEFTKSGDYLVTVTVQNQISIAHAQVLISVLEPIQGVRLLNCCEEGIATGTEKSFSARVGSGSRVSFSWQFCLWKERGRSVVAASGDRVSYAPEAAGLLEIHLTAFNDLGSVNITRTIQVQDPIVQVSLSATNAFVNRTALFEAVVLPSSRSVEFLWSFGDGSSTQTTRVAVANYSYLSPGDYLVEVNATNLISFFIAQLTVTVKVLECEEPEVELALPPQVFIKRGGVPIVSLECVSCKAQSVYEVSKSSYVYLEGTCQNCHNDSKLGRWAAHSFKNKSLILDRTTTSTGDTGMNLVLRPGALRDGEGYTFTLHITDLTTGEEGFASIDLLPNQPPVGGSCRLSPEGPLRALETKPSLHFTQILFPCSSMEIGLPEGFPSLSHWLYNQTDTVLQGLVKQGDPQQVIEYSLALITILNEVTQLVLPKRRLQRSLQSPGEFLGQYERSELLEPEAGQELELRTWTRNTITETLNALKVNTVDDIQQISAALAQCTVVSKELVCKSCLTRTLNKLETMMTILQGETTQGTVTPTGIADNILNITGEPRPLVGTGTGTALGYEHSSEEGHVQRNSEKTARKALSDCFGKVSGVLTVAVIQAIYHLLFMSLLAGDLIHLVNTVSQESKPQELLADSHNLLLAPKAYNLSSSLMRILMKSRVLNEEPLELVGGEIKATGKRSDPFNLLCYENTPNCQFSIPQAFNSTLSNLTDVIQVMFQVDSNPFPFGYISNYTVSTKVASMEFQTHNGVQIPIGSLDSEKAITVMVSNSTEPDNLVAGTEVIEARSSVNLIVIMESNNREAGLHFQLTYRVLNGGRGVISLLFPFPRTDDPIQKYYLNVTNHFSWSAVEVTLGLYTSLCQYFSEQEKRWKTEGIVPLEETRPDQAVCLTQHLTAFGASLFVPPNSVQFIFPAPGPGLNYIVLLTCAVCFVTYSVAALIVHKLDMIDLHRVGVIPFCGKNGMYKYEILVKTGWGRGSGESELRSFWRIFVAELQRGFFEKHVWLSLWDRPPRSRFTRVQRATCCCLLIFLFLCANAVWPVSFCAHLEFLVVHCLLFACLAAPGLLLTLSVLPPCSNVAVSSLLPVSVDTVAVGLVSSVVVYPLYLLILFLFRMARGKVRRGDGCRLLQWLGGTRCLGGRGDGTWLVSVAVSPLCPLCALQVSISHTVTHSDQQSLEIDNYLDSSILDSSFPTFPGLQAEAPLAPEEDTLSLGIHHQGQPRYFSASDEDLIRQILAEGASGISQDLGPYMRAETDLISGLLLSTGPAETQLSAVPPVPGRSSVFGEKVEAVMMQRLNDKGQSVAPPAREVSRSAKSTWTGTRVCPGVLSSLPVPQVLLEALYFSLVAKRLHPEEDDTLVEQPCVEHVSERISKVRPPQGFALFQAKEEARKVKLLHRMLKVGHLLLPGAQGSDTSECGPSQSGWDALSAWLQLLPQFLSLWV
ncbi:hypothetical protein EK904_007642 [Melospiza melodia maxima]|nr:hypothetical protein EK904_007642 [Melospiza melodia maxima]